MNAVPRLWRTDPLLPNVIRAEVYINWPGRCRRIAVDVRIQPVFITLLTSHGVLQAQPTNGRPSRLSYRWRSTWSSDLWVLLF
jgi:hypothetical protein